MGVPIGSEHSQTDKIGTVGTGETKGAGVGAVDGVCRGGGTRSGALTFR